MASEIRVNKIINRSGLSTVTFSDTGAIVSGIVTANSFSGNITGNVTGNVTGSGANLTSIPAGQLTGALPAISGANLTGIAGVTINNNANNRLITGSGTANTLEGEANLQWDGETLYINRSSNSVEGLSISNSNNSQGSAAAQLNLSGGDNSYANVRLECNGTLHHIRQDGSGNLKFYNNTTERLRITSDGKIGINQTSPAHKLHVEDGSSGVIVAKQTTNNGGYNIFEGDASDGTTKFYVTHNGRVGAADGIIFGTDTAAGNILNDYEEGSFTPYLRGNNNNSSPQLNGLGKYTKVGSMVYATVHFGNKNGTHLPSGEYTMLYGLPFTQTSGFDTQVSCPFTYKIDFDASHIYLGYIPNNSTTLWYYYNRNGNTWQPWGTDQWRDSQIYMSHAFTYYTDS